MLLTARKQRLIEDTGIIVTSFVRDHMSCEEIAQRYDVTRQAIWGLLRRNGVDTSHGHSSVTLECSRCGTKIVRTKTTLKRSKQVYCSNECYLNKVRSSEYNEWRQGSRIARKKIRSFFPLDERHVVHHVDGNQRNNDIDNLWVFQDQATHVAFHRGNPLAKPIWGPLDE